MKIPLNYQTTEFDCGTTSLLNVFSYLYKREEIPVKLIKIIYINTLDCHNKRWKHCCGTSKKAMQKIIKLINNYSKISKFNIKCERLEKERVTLNVMISCLKKKGCILVRCWQTTEHYIIITKIDKKYAYIFDPYYINENIINKDRNVKIITNKPFTYNRKVTLTRLFSLKKLDFSLGKISNRECVIFNKIY